MKNYLLFLCTLVCLASASAQSGKVFDALSMKSEILKSERKFAVYLPPDYETSNRSYPVLYLLHGAGDDQTGWVQFGEVLRITDNAIKEGKATPMVIVMPDANTGTRGYFNSIKGGGSFMYALRHPELFSSACPLSAYIGPLSLDDFKQRLKNGNESYEDNLVSAYYERHNALSLIQASSLEELKSVRWFIDCGDDDFLYEGNSLVHIAMKKKEVPHEYRVREGRHSWTYWRESLPVVLEFVSDAFHQY